MPVQNFSAVVFGSDSLFLGFSPNYPTATAAYDSAVERALEEENNYQPPRMDVGGEHLAVIALGSSITTYKLYDNSAQEEKKYYYASANFTNTLRPKFATSTGYLKVYWDESIYLQVSGTGATGGRVVGPAAKTFEYNDSPVGDPDDGYDTNYETYASGTAEVITSEFMRPSTPPEPSVNQYITHHYYFLCENIRWSAVPGYVPPADGSANGFPP